MTNFKFGKSSLEKLRGLREPILEVTHKALEISEYDFSVIDGLRTAMQQRELYEAGKSELDGFNSTRKHQSGIEVDVYPYVRDDNGSLVDCWNYNNPKVKAIWLEVGRAFLRAGRLLGYEVEWGLSYNIDGGYDYPHFQINI